MNDHTAAVQALLQSWFDEGNAAALAEACSLAQAKPVDVYVLMNWLQDKAIAEDAARDLVIRRIRRALGLPMMPGAVCRPTPR